jgi:hypothetical protein
MRTRVQDVVAFATIFGTFYAGILHLAWWAALAGACALALISIHNHRVADRARGATGAPAVVLLSSLANATMAAIGAQAAGRAIAWAVGV